MMMKKILSILAALLPILVYGQEVSGTRQELCSPNNDYTYTFYQKKIKEGEVRMYYTLQYKGEEVVKESELGLDIDNALSESALGIPHDSCAVWGSDLKLQKVERNAVDTQWTPVYGERSVVKDRYNSMSLQFMSGVKGEIKDGYDKRKTYLLDIEVRAYDEGVAMRYHFPEAQNGLFIHLTGERTNFTMPEGTKAFFTGWAQGPYVKRELKDWSENDEAERPLTMELPSGKYVALLEAALVDYSRGKFKLSDTKSNTLNLHMYDSVDLITPYNTPWRVIMAGERAVDLINNNDIVLNLNEPSKIQDTSWIKPGKVFRCCSLKQADVLKGIDFAAERGLQYVHLDAGWYGVEWKTESDATKVADYRDLNIEEIVAKAKEKGLGLWVYVNQRALSNQLDSILPQYKKWGIRGIKFGFVQVGGQKWTTWLHDAVRKCAEYGLMVDIHDEYRPTGFSRTYPNLVNQEGIGGNEEMPDATHDVVLPFTRFVCGAADYTPCYFNKRVKNTKAHQLAMAVVYYQPLEFLYWYDSPSDYKGEEELQFWHDIPTVWDDSRALDGSIGEYIVEARRSGEDWYVGAMTNTESRDITINTSEFLKKGAKYKMMLCEDDSTLETRTKVRTTYKTIKGGSRLTLHLQASGGAAMHFIPVKR